MIHKLMSEDEKVAVMMQVVALRNAGKVEESRALAKTMPMPPFLAKFAKEHGQTDYLKSSGWNLAEAEAALDRTGLIDDIYTSVTLVYKGRELLDTEGKEGAGRISYNGGLSLALTSFKVAQTNAKDDLEAVVLIEQAYLSQELAFCTPIDKKASNSLSNAIKSFDEGLCALKEVEAGASYGSVDRSLPYRRETRFSGMPKDAFHYACSGHLERLDGILHSPGINMTEKAVLEQRVLNIETAQAAYVEKQKKALGLVE